MTTPSMNQPGPPGFAFVLFGGTGDLAMRKILPALYAAHRDGMLAPDGRIISVAMTTLDTQWLSAMGRRTRQAAHIGNSD